MVLLLLLLSWEEKENTKTQGRQKEEIQKRQQHTSCLCTLRELNQAMKVSKRRNCRSWKRCLGSLLFLLHQPLANGGTLKSANPASLLKEAIHVISCGFEDKTDWGKEVVDAFISNLNILRYCISICLMSISVVPYKLDGSMGLSQKIS